ncbi:ornithine carbamoyltransferase [uncultured Gimesia sp.]|uniref:ornithine carbamoyltransferase n=1 Tax=uncultured Gimesia sp. TaxID=1678688 RepID=UPI0030D76A62|tara:strand:- start:64517 stop:65434 length:918 start_codon:yes stop_codon:yes gene_type:complete
MRHLVTLHDLESSEILEIFALVQELKDKRNVGERPQLLQGRTMTQVFEKPSLRTRLSFESAMWELGGGASFFTCKEAGLDGRESIEDVARVVGRYSDIVTLRTFSHELIETFSQNSEASVINALSDLSHPCQALTDLFTMQEILGDLSQQKLVYVGDGNNVAYSLANCCAKLGIPFVVSSPEGFELSSKLVSNLKQQFPSAQLELEADPQKAVAGATVIYTDVWASMGQEAETEKRKKIFADYQINSNLMAAAAKNCRLMHCLPAKRGLEVTDEVLDSKQSIVFEQAENRKHLAKGLLVWLMQQA